MSITITDPALLAQLAQASGIVEFRDANGNLIAEFEKLHDGQLPPGVTSPFTEEEMAERRKHRTGRPLADILKDLRERGGK